jgi:pimeloyl-ACP methyl ester carboxylesterase
MAETVWYSEEKGAEEHILPLDHGRQLAYTVNGPTQARTVVLFFHGLFGVGNAKHVPQPCRDIGARWIAVTLPGMGHSSTRPAGEAYHVSLARDMTALLAHLYPWGDFDKLYVSGGSYGTVQAQMIYGASYEHFPAGRKIAGCMILAGLSPFRHHRTYAKSLNWQNWVSVGPPSRLPFRLFQRLVSVVIASKMKTLEGAKQFLHHTIFSHMDEDEKVIFAKWLEKEGGTEDGFVEDMATGAIRACDNWDGFMEVSDVLHSDWGFAPAQLDEQHAKPMMVVESEKDHLGSSTCGWIAENYKAARLKKIPGGHLSALYYLDDLWSEFIESK